MDPDMNKYDLEHVTTDHPTMSKEELQAVYRAAWDAYYSREHVETLLRRAVASGVKSSRLIGFVFQFYGMLKFENVHPLQGGFLRRKLRRQRRRGMPLENPVLFYARRAREVFSTYVLGFVWYLGLRRIQRRIQGDPGSRNYTDIAIRPVDAGEDEQLDMFTSTESARAVLVKEKRRAETIRRAREKGETASASQTDPPGSQQVAGAIR